MRTVVLTATPQNQGGKPRIAPMRKPPNPLYFLPCGHPIWFIRTLLPGGGALLNRPKLLGWGVPTPLAIFTNP